MAPWLQMLKFKACLILQNLQSLARKKRTHFWTWTSPQVHFSILILKLQNCLKRTLNFWNSPILSYIQYHVSMRIILTILLIQRKHWTTFLKPVTHGMSCTSHVTAWQGANGPRACSRTTWIQEEQGHLGSSHTSRAGRIETGEMPKLIGLPSALW